jgi:hypothetical protein
MNKQDQINFGLASTPKGGGCVQWRGQTRVKSSFGLFYTHDHGLKPAAWYALGCPLGVGLLPTSCGDENCIAEEHQRTLCRIK